MARSAASRPVLLQWACVAAIAAITASIADIGMLAVAHGTFSAPPADTLNLWLLWLGGALGATAIPFYFFGYRACAGLLHSPHAKLIVASGAVVALFGAMTHALTALDIHVALSSGQGTRSPSEAFAASPTPLFICGAITAIAVLISSLLYCLAAWGSASAEMRRTVYFNPVLVTFLLSIMSTSSEDLRAFLLPAAPNLAHVVFFLVCWRALKIGWVHRV